MLRASGLVPVVQWIEQRFPKPLIRVRFPAGAPVEGNRLPRRPSKSQPRRFPMRLLRSLSLLGLLCAAAPGAAWAAHPNVLFVLIDDLRNDLGALGAGHAQTPHLDRLAATSRIFSHHYVQVPTCGASRAALLRGRLPTSAAFVANSAILETHRDWAQRSLPGWLRRHGYRTHALGKVTHHPGGLAGPEWNAPPEELPGVWDRTWIPESPWRTAEAMMHGYADGRPRVRGKSPAWEAVDGPDETYPDAWVARDAVAHLRTLAASEEPWFFAVGFFKPHLPFAQPRAWLERHEADATAAPEVAPGVRSSPGWSDSGELRAAYDLGGRDPNADAVFAAELRRAYAASTSYVDAQVGRVLDEFAALGLERNTIVVVWSDHGFLLGEHAMWGKHTLFEGALRAPLLIRHPGLSRAGETSAAIVESVDVFPTLLDLLGLPAPEGLDGTSLRPQLEDPAVASGRPAHGYWRNGRTIRTERWRLIVYPATAPEGAPVEELFDLVADPGSLRDVAGDHPGVVADLRRLLGRAPSF